MEKVHKHEKKEDHKKSKAAHSKIVAPPLSANSTKPEQSLATAHQLKKSLKEMDKDVSQWKAPEHKKHLLEESPEEKSILSADHLGQVLHKKVNDGNVKANSSASALNDVAERSQENWKELKEVHNSNKLLAKEVKVVEAPQETTNTASAVAAHSTAQQEDSKQILMRANKEMDDLQGNVDEAKKLSEIYSKQK